MGPKPQQVYPTFTPKGQPYPQQLGQRHNFTYLSFQIMLIG